MKNTLSIFEIKNKNILISGACGEIGNDIIKFLHDGGAKIFAFDNNKLDLKKISKINPNINYFYSDICDENLLTKQLKQITLSKIKFDAVINTAGIFSKGPTSKLNIDSYRRVLEVNLTGALIFSKVCSNFLNQNDGRIIHIASVSSLVANPEYAAYSTSKAGLAQLIKILANEWADRKILVNGIGPAMIDGKLAKKYLRNDRFKSNALSSIPLKRFCKTSDLFGTILLLISDAGRFITGQTIYIDGGRTIK